MVVAPKGSMGGTGVARARLSPPIYRFAFLSFLGFFVSFLPLSLPLAIWITSVPSHKVSPKVV